MSSTKLITVVGATGNQGGAVARSLLKNKQFSVRGITRNTESEAAKALSSLGAEMVKADGFNKEEMKAAFTGSWGAFVNTNAEDPSVNQPGGPNETDLGKIIIDAAAEAGVQNLIYSSGANTESQTKGAVYCRMMMQKAKTLHHAQSLSKFTNITSVDAGFYLETWLSSSLAPAFGGFPFIPDDEGYLTITFPRWGGTTDNPAQDRIPFIAIAADYGHIVHGVFLDPAKYNGKLVQGVSDITSFEDVASTFEKVTGKKSRVKYLGSVDEFETFGEKGLEDVREMFRFLQHTGGKYFDGGVEIESETARALKAEAMRAVGGSEEEARLMSIKEFFEMHFGGEKK